jgi:hypothetical protein
MILRDPIRQTETARAELAKAASSTQAWSDQQRQSFDDQRMKPLADAGRQLSESLQKAQEQLGHAERLLSAR